MRARRTTWGRHVLSTFLVAWLAIVLQPCAMAMDVDTDHCPHCPPADTPPCETAVSPDCAFDEQLGAEPRSTQLKLKDLPADLAAAVVPVPQESAELARKFIPCHDASVRIDPSGPPLSVLYCVYLK